MRSASTPVLTALVLLALLSPLLTSFAFSRNPSPSWLVQSGLFLGLALALTCVLSDRASTRPRRFALRTVVLTPLLLLESLRLVSFYLQGVGFNERFFFHLNLNTLVECWTVYPRLTWSVAALLVGFQALLYGSVPPDAGKRTRPARQLLWAVALIPPIFLLESAPRAFWSGMQDVRSAAPELSSAEIESLGALGLDARAIGQSAVAATPGKNLVLIYLEGLESLYTREEVFPGLTPSLDALAQAGLRFPALRQVPGTGWTMGGLVASQCGTPLLIDGAAHGNDIMHNGFLDGAVCLGDVLRAAGYRQSFLGGARLEFAGKGAFFDAHGYDEVLGLLELRRDGAPRDAETWWGLTDEVLFQRAEEKLAALARADRPFNLTLLTLDTHAPSGAPSRSCRPYPHSDNPMLAAVHCTDQLVGRFLHRLATRPAHRDTVVVLLSDHLMMRNAAEPLYPVDAERTLFFTILDGEHRGLRAVSGTAMDVAPTLLDVLGVEHDAAFLAGSSLVETGKNAAAPEFGDREVLDRIRRVNTQRLTHVRSRLCESTQMVRFEPPSSLVIGERRLALVHEGWHAGFRRSFAAGDTLVLAFIGADDEIGDVAIVPAGDAPGLIADRPNDAYLMVVSRNAMHPAPPFLTRSAGQVFVVLGGPQGPRLLLGEFPALEDVMVDGGSCAEQLEAARAPAATVPEAS